MKSIKLLIGLYFLLGAGSGNIAFADPGHIHSGHIHSGHFHHYGPHVGVVIGGPFWWPGSGYYDPYYYGYPPVVTVPAQPPVYIEQAQPDALAPGYWYYCDRPDGYYPYVRQCPGGWQRVAPQQATR